MDIYNETTQLVAREVTNRYSTSFGWATKLMSSNIRNDIYAIYGLVRIADEIVDTYQGDKTRELLDGLEEETYQAIESGFSTNPIVHAFQLTANTYGITKSLIRPFFASMRSDITPPRHFTQKQYETYIYGSAEVVGLMCLKVFTLGDATEYAVLKSGASRLGAAYQKVNFLRDFAADSQQLGRIYFPNVASRRLEEAEKGAIIADIQTDFAYAQTYVNALPNNARIAVAVSFAYYQALLTKLAKTPATSISVTRIRISNFRKLAIMIKTILFYSIRPRSRVA